MRDDDEAFPVIDTSLFDLAACEEAASKEGVWDLVKLLYGEAGWPDSPVPQTADWVE